MTDDIFDYFSGNSNRKVEPIDDDDEQVESSIDPDPSDVTETEIDDGPLPDAKEVDEKVSHWDRLLGKLGISPAAKTTAPPKSVQLPAVSAEEKAARASRRKEQEKARSQEVQPFGGIAAPPGSKPLVEPKEPQVAETPRAESATRAPTEAKKSNVTKKDKPAAASSKFGMGILDEISTEVPERVTPHGTETLADLFVASEQFEPPFEEARREIDDLEPFPTDDLEPHSVQLDEEPGQTSEIDDDDDDAEFIEYEVQDLDFAESDEERPRRPSRRDRARRGRSKPEFEGPDAQKGGRVRRDQALDDTPKPQAPPRRGRNTRDQDDEDLGFEKEEPTTVEADSTPARGRRRSRGRSRGRGSRDSRPPRDAVDRVEIDDVEIDESLEIADREEFDDQEEGRNRNRGRKPRGASRRSRPENRVQNDDDIDDDIDDDSFGVYDDDEPKSARESGRRRQTGDKDIEFDPGKRPQIPTWSEAVAAMVDLNIKARGSKPSGSGRGRGPRRPRRR